MATWLQNNINKEWLIHIVKLLHPGLEESVINDKIKWYKKYTWICISFRVKGYGQIDIGLDNHDSNLYGRISKAILQEAFDNNQIKSRVWRFCLDKYCDTENGNIGIEEVNEYVNNTMPKPSFNEFWDNYWSD